MSGLKWNLNIEGLGDQMNAFKRELEEELMFAASSLAPMTHQKALKMAQNELHSTRDLYVKALNWEKIADGVWVVSLEENALFIEEGLPQSFDMKPGLLKNAKVTKKGIRYRVIPFDHTKAPTSMTVRQNMIAEDIKSGLKELEKKRIARGDQGTYKFTGTARDPNGGVVSGKIHSNLNLGGQIPGQGNTPWGKNVNVYQKPSLKGTTATRSIKTFRTVSDGPNSMGKWLHPGLEAKKFMDKALEESMADWENNIVPLILAKWQK